MSRLILFVLLAVLAVSLFGCTTTTYSMICGDKRLDIKAEGQLFTRAVDDVDLAMDGCGSSHVAGAKTDAVQAFREGLKAAKEIAGAAAAGPAGAAAAGVVAP